MILVLFVIPPGTLPWQEEDCFVFFYVWLQCTNLVSFSKACKPKKAIA